MIKINLAPLEELENPYWWVPDVSLLVLVALVAYLGVNYYLGRTQKQIDALNADADSYRSSSAQLAGDLKRFETLGHDIASLKSKLDAIQKITVSKITRYEPVILLEHLQNLRPEGLWFTGVQTVKDDDQALQITGGALDSLLVGEFMSALLATNSQPVDPADLRTQVYFEKADLTYTKVGDRPVLPDLSSAPEFQLTVHFKEREVSAKLPQPVSFMPRHERIAWSEQAASQSRRQ